MDQYNIPLSIVLGTAGTAVIYLLKVWINEELADRRERRESRKKVAESESEAFKEHVKECTERRVTFARLEQKVDDIKTSMEGRTAKVDAIFEGVAKMSSTLDGHIENDEKFQQRIEKAIA